MGLSWSIRPATSDDIGDLQRIEVEAGRRFIDAGLGSIAHDEAPSPEALNAHISRGAAWVAEADGDVVGYAISSIVDGEAHLDQISVSESHGRQGIGAALITRVEDWGATQGLAALTLTTFTEVAWNGPWYERLGFKALAPAELGPGLRAIRNAETAAGIDVSPRTAMSKALGDAPSGSG